VDENSAFRKEVEDNVRRMGEDAALRRSSLQWMLDSAPYKYSYNFRWLGRPVIQFPQDLMALQEIIWNCRPELIVETGIAHGGSLIFFASMLQLLGGPGKVIGIDVDIRPHNRAEIERHPLAHRVEMIEGSSIAPDVVAAVRAQAPANRKVLVVLDSDHTHRHVLEELAAYSPLVGKGSYVVVLDTIVEDVPEKFVAGRAWARGNNPKTAVHEFLRGNGRFQIDAEVQNKLLITVAPDGYLRCIKD
jgi:cephalosporin hydroxylase